VLDPFQFEFVQRGLAEVLLLSVAAGLLGTWIVLRGLAFFSHAVGAAAFPGLVLAEGLGFPVALGAFGAALLFTVGVERLGAGARAAADVATAVVLAGALALGVILAGDVFHSGSNVDSLLFGSLLVLNGGDLALAGATSAIALAATWALGRTWLATGFDPVSARALGLRSPLPDAALLLLVALVAVASLTALGALLVAALLVIPAATVRLWTRRLFPWQVATVGLVAAEGTVGLWAAVQLNAPPGPAIATLAGAVFALAALARVAAKARPRRVAVAAAAAALVALPLTGCGTPGGAGPQVVATTTQIADWARQVAGRDSVHQLLRPNTDPHAYEPRPADIQAVGSARLVLANGDGLDHWIDRVVKDAGGHARLVRLGDHVPVLLPGDQPGQHDPHWWFDARNAVAAVQAIAAAMAQADPAHAAAYRANAARYVARVRGTDAAIAACLSRLGPSERALVTSHDAFNYFAPRYGLHIVGAVIPAQTTQAQPSARELADLVALIRRQRVRAVFAEKSVSPKVAEAVAREAGANARLRLYGDTLGPQGSPGATYLGMLRANADAIARGLSGGRVRCGAT
jgi:ABC-type Zn uptake system ZnuABC Zn-binding protein ZnuA/ABC-type Mn2+/Zn2+ transport system permease subunit